MAFRNSKRKEFKKSSYYVWFLGAKESKGLRGEEFIIPVVRSSIEREKELEPMKITLQLSHKGMKIVQTVPKKTNKNKTEQIKHFIPHHAITSVYQESEPDDDVISTILLIFNPLTKCPVHVHTYRCDSSETASKLKQQLQTLIERPENQKKFREIENRLAAKGLMPGLTRRTLNSDGRSTRTDDSSDSGGGHGSDKDLGLGASPTHITSLYDSLAAELRQKLGNKNKAPLLLPPKDYDTVCRNQGRLLDINKRRSQQVKVVGTIGIFPPTSGKVEQDPAFTSDKDRGDCSGKSSGIGSDEALSTAIQEVSLHPDFENKIDPDTSSDEEEWTENDIEPQEEAPIIQQPVPRDEVFTQMSWRRQPTSPPKSKPLPTYHYSDQSAFKSNVDQRSRPESVIKKSDETYNRQNSSTSDPPKINERRCFIMYPDERDVNSKNEVRKVYMTREEFERLERQQPSPTEPQKTHVYRQDSRQSSSKYPDDEYRRSVPDGPDPRYKSYPRTANRTEHETPYRDVDEPNRRRPGNEEVRYRRRDPTPRDQSADRSQYVRNKPPTKVPAHYRHSHVDRLRSNEPEEPRDPHGYEIRHSNSLHQLNNSKYDWGRVPHLSNNDPERGSYGNYDEHPAPHPERRLVHSTTLERFPPSHEKYHSSGAPPRTRNPSVDRKGYSSEIPGLVDPRRKSLHLEHLSDHPRGYRGSFVEGYNSRNPGPRYTMTPAQQF